MSNIGSKRERIRIVRQTKARRADGGYDRTPATICEFWASVKPVSANEAEQAGRKSGAVTYIITAPRRDDFTTEDKVVWLTRSNIEMNIREIRKAGARPLFMDFVAESGVTQ